MGAEGQVWYDVCVRVRLLGPKFAAHRLEYALKKKRKIGAMRRLCSLLACLVLSWMCVQSLQNMLEVYVFWNFHEAEEGNYNFEGAADLFG